MNPVYNLGFRKFFEKFSKIDWYRKLLKIFNALSNFNTKTPEFDETKDSNLEYQRPRQAVKRLLNSGRPENEPKQVGTLSLSSWEAVTLYKAFCFRKEVNDRDRYLYQNLAATAEPSSSVSGVNSSAPVAQQQSNPQDSDSSSSDSGTTDSDDENSQQVSVSQLPNSIPSSSILNHPHASATSLGGQNLGLGRAGGPMPLPNSMSQLPNSANSVPGPSQMQAPNFNHQPPSVNSANNFLSSFSNPNNLANTNIGISAMSNYNLMENRGRQNQPHNFTNPNSRKRTLSNANTSSDDSEEVDFG